MSRKQGGSGPPPGGGHSRGGKRKLVVDSSLSMHSEDEVSGPAQKPRMEDDLLGKFLQLVQRTFEKPMVDLSSSAILPPTIDLLSEIDAHLYQELKSGGSGTLGVAQTRRLLAIVELILSEIIRMESDPSSSKKGGAPEVFMRFRGVAVAFVSSCVQHAQRHLLGASRGVEALDQAVRLLELMDGNLGVHPAPKATILAQLSNQTASYLHVPLSKELHGRINALIFGQCTPSPPAGAKSSPFDVHANQYGPDYELTMEQRDAVRPVRSSTSASTRPLSGPSLAMPQRCVRLLLEMCIGLLKDTTAVRHFAGAAQRGGASSGAGQDADGNAQVAALGADADVQGTLYMMTFIDRTVQLVLAIETATREEMNASRPFPVPGSSAITSKCFELASAITAANLSWMDRAQSLLAAAKLSGQAQQLGPALVREADGGKNLSPVTAGLLENLLSVVALHDTGPSVGTSAPLRTYVVGQLVRCFPRPQHLSSLIEETRKTAQLGSSSGGSRVSLRQRSGGAAATRALPASMPAELTRYAVVGILDELVQAQQAGESVALAMDSGKAGDTLAEVLRAVGGSPGRRASWLLGQLLGSAPSSAAEALDIVLVLLIQAVEGEQVVESLVESLFSLLSVAVESVGSGSHGPNGAALRLTGLYHIARRMAALGMRGTQLAEAVASLFKSMASPQGMATQITGCVLGETRAWPIYLADAPCVLLASVFSMAAPDASVASTILDGLMQTLTAAATTKASRASSSTEESRFGRAHARLLALVFHRQGHDACASHIARFMSLLAKIAEAGKQPVSELIVEGLQLLDVMLDSLVTEQGTAAVEEPLPWQEVVAQLEGQQGGSCDAAELWPSSSPWRRPLKLEPGASEEQLRRDLLACIARLNGQGESEEEGDDGTAVLLAVTLLQRLPAPQALVSPSEEWVGLSELLTTERLPSVEAIDRLRRVAAACCEERQLTESESAADAGPSMNDVVDYLRDCSGAEESSMFRQEALRQAVVESLLHIVAYRVSACGRCSEEELIGLVEAFHLVLQRHEALLQRAVAEMWSQCDPAALFEDVGEGVEIERPRARLVTLSILLLRMGHNQPHLADVSGSLEAFHRGFSALSHEDPATACPAMEECGGPLDLGAAVVEAVEAQVQLLACASRDEDSVEKVCRLVKSTIRTMSALVEAAGALVPYLVDGSDTSGELAAVFAELSSDGTLSCVHSRSQRLLERLSAPALVDAARLTLAARTLEETVSDEGPAQQILTVLGEALTTHCLSLYAEAVSSEDGRVGLVHHFTNSLSEPGEPTPFSVLLHSKASGNATDATSVLLCALEMVWRPVRGLSCEHGQVEPAGLEAHLQLVHEVANFFASMTTQQLSDLALTCLVGSKEVTAQCFVSILVTLTDGAGWTKEAEEQVNCKIYDALLQILPEAVRSMHVAALTAVALAGGLGLRLGRLADTLERLTECAEQDGLSSLAQSCIYDVMEGMLEACQDLCAAEQESGDGEEGGEGNAEGGEESDGGGSRMEVDESPGGSDAKPASTIGASSKLCTSVMQSKAVQETQVWYQCHTCGVKCCTVCAGICHQGHDLSYAHTGGQAACRCAETVGPGLRRACRCLKPASADGDERKGWRTQIWRNKLAKYPFSVSFSYISQELCDMAIIPASVKSSCVPAVWRGLSDLAQRVAALTCSMTRSVCASAEPCFATPAGASILSEAVRDVEDATLLRPVCVLPASSLERSSTDSSRTRQLKTLTAWGQARRQLITANASGNVAFVEQESVVVASAFPLLLPIQEVEHQVVLRTGSRSSLCVLSKMAVSFQVLGVAFNASASSQLLVWGAKECLVFTLSATGSVARRYSLDMALDAVNFTGTIKSACWVPGSSSLLCLVSEASVRVFDFMRTSNMATHSFRSTGCDNAIVDAVLLPAPSSSTSPSPIPDASLDLGATLIVLTKSLKVYRLRLTRPCARPAVTIDSRIESAVSMPLPLPPGQGVPEEGPHSLHYSASSKLMVVTWDECRVLGFQFDEAMVRIESSSWLLTADMVDSASSVFSPASQGPFTRWIDWPGTSDESGGQAQEHPTLVVAGRTCRARQERPFVMQLSSPSEVKVQQLSKTLPEGPFVSEGVIEGMCVMPAIDQVGPALFVLYDNGCLQVFGNAPAEGQARVRSPAGVIGVGGELERILERRTASLDAPLPDEECEGDTWDQVEEWKAHGPCRAERMTDVTRWPALTIVGEGMREGSKSEPYVCPRVEGGTLAIRLENRDMEISLVRLRVGGSSLVSVPKEVRLFGRARRLEPRTARWYDLVVKAEDLPLLRGTGAVLLSVGPCWEDEVPIIDSIEVFATSRLTSMSRQSSRQHFIFSSSDAQAAVEAHHVLARTVVADRQRSAAAASGESPPFPTADALKAVELTLSQTWGRKSQRHMARLREGARMVLGEVFMELNDYHVVKDRMQLSHVSRFMEELCREQAAGGSTAVVPALRAAVALGLKIVINRSKNMYSWATNSSASMGDESAAAGEPRLFFKSCAAALVRAAKGAGVGTDQDRLVSRVNVKLDDVAGDVVELGLRELALVVQHEGKGAAAVQEGLELLLSVLDCPSKGLSGAFAAMVVELAKAARGQEKAGSSGASKLGGAEADAAMDIDEGGDKQGEESAARGGGAGGDVFDDGMAHDMETDYRCDGCEASPLLGARWHCQVCPDFDLCGKCYEDGRGGHDADHPMLRHDAAAEAPAPSAISTGISAGESDAMVPMAVVIRCLYTMLVESLSKTLGLDGSTEALPFLLSWSPDTAVARLGVCLSLVRTLGSEGLSERALSLADTLASCFKAAVTRFTATGERRDLKRSPPLTDILFIVSRALEFFVTSILRVGQTPSTSALPTRPCCPAHGLPATLHEWPSGEFQGRLFYSCSLKGDKRCDFVQLLDEQGRRLCSAKPSEPPAGLDDLPVATMASWHASKGPLSSALAVILESLAPGPENIEASLCELLSASLPGPPMVAASLTKGSVRASWPRPSSPVTATAFESQLKHLQGLLRESGQALGASLLLALAAICRASGQAPSTEWRAGWVPLLCQLIEGTPAPSTLLKSAAKRFLRALAGSRTDYQRLRDRFVMAESFKGMATLMESAAKAGRTRVAVDSLPYTDQVELRSSLNRLVKVAEARPANWRQFVNREQDEAGVPSPPICMLFDLCVSIDEELQLLCLNLLDIASDSVQPSTAADAEGECSSQDSEMEDDEALDEEEEDVREEDEDEVREESGMSRRSTRSEDDMDVECGAGDDDSQPAEAPATPAADTAAADTAAAGAATADAAPVSEAVAVLVSNGKLTGTVVMAWITDVVLRARLAAARPVCGLLLRRFWSGLPISEKTQVLTALTTRASLLPEHGAHAEEVFLLLDSIASGPELGPNGPLAAVGAELAGELVKAFQQQLAAVQNHPHAEAYSMLDAILVSPHHHLDSDPCVSCLRTVADKETAYRVMTLDSLKTAQRSTETTHIVAFKSRQRIRRISLKVHEPHGRLVKIIRVSYYGRTVTSLNELQVPENLHKWQRLATLNLTVGQTGVDVDLPMPVVAGCLLMEYDEFHLTGPLAPSKSSLLHCPQCGRQVSDPHGVCRHCGEVAFQCRQCRHINYERFDAFLCVECGYCAYGQFTYRVTAAPAPDATPVTSMAERDAALRQHAALALKLQEERQKVAASVPELLRLIHEMETHKVPPPATLSPPSNALTTAMASDVGSNLMSRMDRAVKASMGGVIVHRTTEEDKPAMSSLQRVLPAGARFVFVSDTMGDLETESRDGDDDDADEDAEDAALMDIEGNRLSRVTGVSADNPPPPASLLDTVDSSRRPGLFRVSGVDLPVPAGASSTASSRAASTTSQASSTHPQGRGHARQLVRSAPAKPATASASESNKNGLARPSLAASVLAAAACPPNSTSLPISSQAKGSWLTGQTCMQRAVDYYSKTCRAHHEKAVKYARDMLLLTDELVAYHRSMLGGSAASDRLELSSGARGNEVSVSRCLSCGSRVVKLLLDVLTTLAKQGHYHAVLMGRSLPSCLIESAVRARDADIRVSGRKLLHALSAAASREERVALMLQLQASFLPVRAVVDDAAMHYLEAMYELCILDALPEPSALREQKLSTWEDHLMLPLRLVRGAAAAAQESVVASMSVALPCLELISAVVGGRYPSADDLHDDSGVHDATAAFAQRVLDDLLAAEREGLGGGGPGAWVTVTQQQKRDRANRVLARWRKGHASMEVAGSGDAVERSGLADREASWWIMLLLNQHSLDIRKGAALLLLELLKSVLGDELDQHDVEEGEDDEDDDEDEETKEDAEEAESKEQEGEGVEDQDKGQDQQPTSEEAAVAVARPSMVPSRVLDLLMMALSDAPASEVSWQLIALLRHLISVPSHAAFLVVRGAVPFLVQRIREEVQRLQRRESQVMMGLALPSTSDHGDFLLQLVETLRGLLAHAHIRRRALRKHMAGLLRTLLSIKLDVILQTRSIASALSIMQELTSPPVAGVQPAPPADAAEQGATAGESRPASPAAEDDIGTERRTYLQASAELMSTFVQERGGVGSLEPVARQAVIFLLQNMKVTVDPPKQRPRFRVHLRRAPSQEEFFRGSLAKNPVWVTEVPLSRTPGNEGNGDREPLMRDLRSMIARELDIPDATDLLELLVTSKIVNVDVPLRLVFEQLWRPYVVERHPDDYGSPDITPESFPPLIVTYRLAGVDGEATEEVVESLVDADEAAAGAGAESAKLKFQVTSVLGDCGSLSLLLELGRPPASHASPAEAWEMSVSATTLLHFCSRNEANRRALLEAHAPATLLTYLLTVLRLSSGGEGPTSELTERLLQIIAELGGGTGAVAGDAGSWQAVGAMGLAEEAAELGAKGEGAQQGHQAVSLIDHLSDRALVEALLRNPFLVRAVARLLPSLTYGREDDSKALADRIHADVNWAVLDEIEGPPSEGDKLRLNVVLESLAGLQADTSSSSRMLRDMLLQNGFTASVVAVVCRDLPESGIHACVSECQERSEFLRRKEQIETDWQCHLLRSSLIQGLRVLTGLSKGHRETQQLLLEQGFLRVLHDMEEIKSSGEAGSLAEVLLELVESDGHDGARHVIGALRRQTREHKRRLAQQNRDRALQAMGIGRAVDASGSSSTLGTSPAKPAASEPMVRNEATQVDAMDVSEASEASEQQPQQSEEEAGAAKPKWMAEMEGLEEEDGLTCMVCQEGYSFKPKEVLGLYIFSKAIGSLDLTSIEGDALVSGAAGGGESGSSLAPPSSGLRSEMGSSRASRRSCRVVTTVTAFNLIHFTCHAEACKADRALRQPKSEWDGAALRNSRVACNGMFPVRGPASMDEAYRLAIEKYFSRLVSVAQQAPISRFSFVVHDVRILLMRLAFQESLRDDCGGGSLGSNVKLLPYQAQLGHYVLERIAAGDEAMGQSVDVRRQELALQMFLAKARQLEIEGKGRPPELASELQEAAGFMAVLSVFLLSRDAWTAARSCFVRLLLIHAGVRKARGDLGSGACQARRRSRSIVSNASAGTTEGGSVGRKRRRSMSEGSESDLSLSQASAAEEERRAAREAARPWLIFLCLLDDLNKAYKPHGSGWDFFSREAGALYSDDDKIRTHAEAMVACYEKELLPEDSTGAPSVLMARLGYEASGSGSSEEGSGWDEEILRLVKFGQSVYL